MVLIVQLEVGQHRSDEGHASPALAGHFGGLWHGLLGAAVLAGAIGGRKALVVGGVSTHAAALVGVRAAPAAVVGVRAAPVAVEGGYAGARGRAGAHQSGHASRGH